MRQILGFHAFLARARLPVRQILYSDALENRGVVSCIFAGSIRSSMNINEDVVDRARDYSDYSSLMYGDK